LRIRDRQETCDAVSRIPYIGRDIVHIPHITVLRVLSGIRTGRVGCAALQWRGFAPYETLFPRNYYIVVIKYQNGLHLA